MVNGQIHEELEKFWGILQIHQIGQGIEMRNQEF